MYVEYREKKSQVVCVYIQKEDLRILGFPVLDLSH